MIALLKKFFCSDSPSERVAAAEALGLSKPKLVDKSEFIPYEFKIRNYETCGKCGGLNPDKVAPIFIGMVPNQAFCDCPEGLKGVQNMEGVLSGHIAKYGIPKELL